VLTFEKEVDHEQEGTSLSTHQIVSRSSRVGIGATTDADCGLLAVIATAEVGSRRARLAALLLIGALAAGPLGTHVYWMLGGTWGLHQETSTGIRIVAAFVVVPVVAAMSVVLARVGLWQTSVSDRVIWFLAWGLAAFFVGHGLVSFVEGFAGIADEWWLYGPSGLVIGLLALVVARSERAAPRLRRPRGALPTQ